jgi:acetolactate decarboxylase
MPTLSIDVPETLLRALQDRSNESGDSIRQIVLAALAGVLEIEPETLFQVSTSAALVRGVFDGTLTVGDLKEHGDFGLGTFDGLDGELVAFDGHFYQVRGNGEVRVPDEAAEVPFAVVTHFKAEREFALGSVASFADLTAQLDRQRQTDNLFYAVRLDGRFTRLETRSVFPADAGETLVEATSDQTEFVVTDAIATAIGFWTPAYARTLGVPGWHIHVLTSDRAAGGHLLDCQAEALRVQMQDLADVRIAMPETPEFLAADLNQDPAAALATAERDRRDT